MLNHLLASQPSASSRLRPHAGRRLCLAVRGLPWPLDEGIERRWYVRVTAAGLLEAMVPDLGQTLDRGVDLAMEMDLADKKAVLDSWRALGHPPVHLSGDAALATDVGWVMDHLRWDWEDDVHRWLGPWAAVGAASAARNARELVSRLSAGVAFAASRWSGPKR